MKYSNSVKEDVTAWHHGPQLRRFGVIGKIIIGLTVIFLIGGYEYCRALEYIMGDFIIDSFGDLEALLHECDGDKVKKHIMRSKIMNPWIME